MKATIARRRLGPSFTTQDNIVYLHDLGRKAREAEAARIAELLGPAGMVFLRELLAGAS